MGSKAARRPAGLVSTVGLAALLCVGVGVGPARADDYVGWVACPEHPLCSGGYVECTCAPGGGALRRVMATPEDGGDGGGVGAGGEVAAGSEVVSLDARGWPTAYETDDDGDGVVDYRVAVTLDGNGNVALERFDAGADGVDDVVSRTQYDERGFATRVEYDNDADGVVDMVFVQRNTYDDAGRIVREEVDAGVDGTVDVVRRYVWDAAGRLVATGGDADGDGVFEASEGFVYDDAGRLVASSADLDPESDQLVQCTHAPPCAPCGPPLPAWRCPECAAECVFVPRPPTGGLDP